MSTTFEEMVTAHHLIESLGHKHTRRVLDFLLEELHRTDQAYIAEVTQFITCVSHELGEDCPAVKQLRRLIAVDDLGVV